jgi:uncharacterized membrane protein
MKRMVPLLLLPLALGCAATPRPYAPVDNVRYSALGAEPFWLLNIGDDRIVLRRPDHPDTSWPRTLPRTENGVRIWLSGEEGAAIRVEARPGPCGSESGQVHADHVVVRVAGAELAGCGGRLIEREQR